MAADNALQVVVAAGECTHLIFCCPKTNQTAKRIATVTVVATTRLGTVS